jgi:hypothetical protein
MLFLLKTMASTGPPTDEAPLHPEIRSFISLATAHMQKIYRSGPVFYQVQDGDRADPRTQPGEGGGCNVWAQLRGTTLSLKRRELDGGYEEVPLKCMDVTDVVRPPFHLCYLHHPAKPPSLGT